MNTIGKRHLLFAWVQSITMSFVVSTPGLSAPVDSVEANGGSEHKTKVVGSKSLPLAIREYERALKIDPNYPLARQRLVETYIEYGKSLEAFPNEALKQFHRAYFLDEFNSEARELIDETVRKIGAKPDSFDKRRALGEAAFERGDFVDSVVEFEMALCVQPDAAVLTRVKEARNKLSGTLFGELSKPQADTKTGANPYDFGPYMKSLQRQIKTQWTPPAQKVTKACVVLFKIQRDGALNNLKLQQSSGDSMFDMASLEAVTQAAPFRELPDQKLPSVDIQFSFDYNVFNSEGTDQKHTPTLPPNSLSRMSAAVFPSLAR